MVATVPYILLTAYEGAEFIASQVESIQNQSLRNWISSIRDDDSHDGTIDIVTRLAANDDRIRLVDDIKGNIGVVRNFNHLMKKAFNEGTEVVLFADQDDVWLPEKLQIQLDLLKQMEKKYGITTPLLIHSDLTVVDEQNSTLSVTRLWDIRASPMNWDLPWTSCWSRIMLLAAQW